VASFLGWPAMNFIDGRLVPLDGGVAFEAPGVKMQAAPAKADDWGRHLGRAVTLGLRPEDVQPARPGESGLAMEVALMESLGPECLATFERNGLRLSARLIERQGIETNQTIEVGFRMEHAHLFDSRSGMAMVPGRPAG
jgi:multiple sugar transport system ATP-binding protein